MHARTLAGLAALLSLVPLVAQQPERATIDRWWREAFSPRPSTRAPAAETSGALRTAGLAGQLFYQQVVPIELDVMGHIAALTSTNRLALTIGTL